MLVRVAGSRPSKSIISMSRNSVISAVPAIRLVISGIRLTVNDVSFKRSKIRLCTSDVASGIAINIVSILYGFNFFGRHQTLQLSHHQGFGHAISDCHQSTDKLDIGCSILRLPQAGALIAGTINCYIFTWLDSYSGQSRE